MKGRLAIAMLAVLVILAGCAGGSGQATSQTEGTTATTTTTQTTQTATPTPEPTPTATWTSPKPPNSPTQTNDEQLAKGRIKNVEFTNTVAGADGEGYANFDLSVTANTSMQNVDPEHGTVDGEPYFVVLINGELMERTKLVLEDEEGQYDIQVRGGGLTKFDPGTLEITVLLMDEDSQNDDVFGKWTGTVEYNPR